MLKYAISAIGAAFAVAFVAGCGDPYGPPPDHPYPDSGPYYPASGTEIHYPYPGTDQRIFHYDFKVPFDSPRNPVHLRLHFEKLPNSAGNEPGHLPVSATHEASPFLRLRGRLIVRRLEGWYLDAVRAPSVALVYRPDHSVDMVFHILRRYPGHLRKGAATEGGTGGAGIPDIENIVEESALFVPHGYSARVEVRFYYSRL